MTKLATRNEHLGLHRRLIVTRSVAAGAAGLLPLPFVDDWAAAAIKRGAVLRLADGRRVDLSEAAARAIAEGREPPPNLASLLKSTGLSLLMRKSWRKTLLLLSVARRADEVGRTFAVLTLFDHYCARVHVGAGLEVEKARELRAAIDVAVYRSRGGLLGRLITKALKATGRALVRAPVEIADAATGGRIRKLLAKNEEDAAEEVLEESMARAADVPSGFFARSVRAIEDELTQAGGAWQSDLVTAFEQAYRRDS